MKRFRGKRSIESHKRIFLLIFCPSFTSYLRKSKVLTSLKLDIWYSWLDSRGFASLSDLYLFVRIQIFNLFDLWNLRIYSCVSLGIKFCSYISQFLAIEKVSIFRTTLRHGSVYTYIVYIHHRCTYTINANILGDVQGSHFT